MTQDKSKPEQSAETSVPAGSPGVSAPVQAGPAGAADTAVSPWSRAAAVAGATAGTSAAAAQAIAAPGAPGSAAPKPIPPHLQPPRYASFAMAPVQGPLPATALDRGYTPWPKRVWPLDPAATAPPWFVAGAIVVAVLGGAFWHVDSIGIGYVAVAGLVFALGFGVRRRRPTIWQFVGVAVCLALLGVLAVRDAGWLAPVCAVAAWIVGWCALAGGRTWKSMLLGPFAMWLSTIRAVGWYERAVRGLRRQRTSSDKTVRVAIVAAVTVGLVLLFGALFAGADAGFARFLDALTPTFEAPDWPRMVFVGGFVLGMVLATGYLLRFPPTFDKITVPQPKVRTWEWAVPLAALDVLFIAFVIVHGTYFFGDHDHVQRQIGLTYAEYARQGFWHLLWVSALTLLVIWVAVRLAATTTRRQRLLVRGLVGVLCVVSLVIVASAINKMRLYEQAYGLSSDRVLVFTFEFWLGLIYVMICVAGVRMSAAWLPRATLLSGAVVVLGLAAINPDRLIAERNIDRFAASDKIDLAHLSRLSADAVPALERLPEAQRACVQRAIVQKLGEPDEWYEFNWSRSQARNLELADCDNPDYLR